MVTPKREFDARVSELHEDRIIAHIEGAIRRARHTPIRVYFEPGAIPPGFDMSPIVLKYAEEGWSLTRDLDTTHCEAWELR